MVRKGSGRKWALGTRTPMPDPAGQSSEESGILWLRWSKVGGKLNLPPDSSVP